MTWQEFSGLLAGIGPDTPLGRIVQIRSETDKDILDTYTPDMKKIRAEWISKRARQKAQSMSDEDLQANLEALKSFFAGYTAG